MKKILFLLFALVPALMSAQETTPNYLAGAVPEKDGLVTFEKSFATQGKSQTDVFTALRNTVKSLVAEGRQELRTRVVSEESNTIVARVEEIMTFKKKFLNWDHCYFRYLISAEATSDGKATVTIKNISYYYGFDQEGNGGDEFKAEEWISDKAAINKAGTKLYPRSGKFRRKTVDRVNEIFNRFQGAL